MRHSANRYVYTISHFLRYVKCFCEKSYEFFVKTVIFDRKVLIFQRSEPQKTGSATEAGTRAERKISIDLRKKLD